MKEGKHKGKDLVNLITENIVEADIRFFSKNILT